MNILNLGLTNTIATKVQSMGFTLGGEVKEISISLVDEDNSIHARMRRKEVIDLVRMLNRALNAQEQKGYEDFSLKPHERQGKDGFMLPVKS